MVRPIKYGKDDGDGDGDLQSPNAFSRIPPRCSAHVRGHNVFSLTGTGSRNGRFAHAKKRRNDLILASELLWNVRKEVEVDVDVILPLWLLH